MSPSRAIARRLQRRDLAREDLQHRGILVAHVDVAALRLDRPGGDQHPLQEQVRRALEVVAVLERARLALVAVDREVARTRVASDEPPLRPGGEARAAQAPQARRLHLRLHRLPVAGLPEAGELGIAAARPIGVERLVVRDDGVDMAAPRRRQHGLGRRAVDMGVPDLAGRRVLAAAHAGRALYADLRGVGAGPQRLGQGVRARDLAGQAVADPDREGGGRRLALLHGVEMGVEGRDLPDLRHGQAHLLRQGAQMARGEMAVRVLYQVEVLDQQVAPPWPLAEQVSDLGPGGVLDLPALGMRAPAAPPPARRPRVDPARAAIRRHVAPPRSSGRTLTRRRPGRILGSRRPAAVSRRRPGPGVRAARAAERAARACIPAVGGRLCRGWTTRHPSARNRNPSRRGGPPRPSTR